jgi:HlyD family secretion protein
MDTNPDQKNNIAQVLSAERPTGRRGLRWIVALTVLLLLVVTAYLLLIPGQASAVRYETAKVNEGDLTVTVTATGTLQPVNQVDVGSELSGVIDSVAVDFNDRVKRGQVLARLNTDRLQARVIESRAVLESGKAKLEEAKATVLETRLRFDRCEQLAARKLCAQEELDTDRAASARAKAVESSAQAQVAVARATLGGNETELGKAEIRSPIDGLVLQRQIEPGQTVAASLQAPVLFTLAEDLAQMELIVAVDEADVGKIEDGQQAEFSVDAYPEQSFPARITQVRFAPQTIEGVVTYETVLAVDNTALLLRPGMTATAVITVQQLHGVTLVPNAALRFTPAEKKVEQRSGGGIFGALFRRPNSGRRNSDIDKNGGKKVWVLRDGQPEAVAVKTGASDGKFTEVRSDDIHLGQLVVIDSVAMKK